MTKTKKAVAILTAMFTAGIGIGIEIYGYFANAFNPPKTQIVTTYTIQPKDTIWHIAETYRKLDCRNPYILEFKEELIKLNPTLDAGALHVGDKIQVRYYVRD